MKKRNRAYRALLAGVLAAVISLPAQTVWAAGPGENLTTPADTGSTRGPGQSVQETQTAENQTTDSTTVVQTNPNAWKRVGGTYQMADGTGISGVLARGIDVSRWQGEINWSQVAADDVSFVMLGTRSRGAVDPYFHSNIQQASNAGIKVGVYIYSLATTTEMAVQEADFVIDLIKDYPVSYPVALDMEDSTQGALSKEELAQIANAFCSRISEAGYYPMIYANDYWLANRLDMSLMNYPVWAANYSSRPSYASPVMWQATSSGSINGISGRVDIDFQFSDFSGVIPANLWRTIGGNRYYYQNYALQKNTWINDGQGWYYMNGEGLVTTGWFTENGSRYYLDETTGRMVQGWKEQDGSWYYLGSSGAADKGWINDNGTWYYTDQNGVMQTGWLQLETGRYYLRGSGARATGWREVDGHWYYFDGEGRMTTGWQQAGGVWYYMNGEGHMQTGLIQVDGASYYLDEQGRMAASQQVVADGVAYQADGSGVLSQIPAETTPEGGTDQNLDQSADQTGTGSGVQIDPIG